MITHNYIAIAQINLSALTHNLRVFKQWMPQQKILPMVKSNAYGHGMILVARALSEADALGVACLSEALLLREAGIEKDIVVMRGFVGQEELTAFLNDPGLIACVHDPAQVDLLEHTIIHTPLSIWLKVDTGMHRLGIDIDQFSAVFQRLSALPAVKKPMTLMSHLADADNPDTTFTQQQLTRFFEITKKLPGEKSVLNSAGMLAYSKSAYEWVRPGIMLYGISPFEDLNRYADRLSVLKPVMCLQTHLISMKTVRCGESIGYGCAYRASKDMTVGVIGFGYGDGYPRHMKTGTPVLIQQQRCPIVGRVSMDMVTVDLSDCPHAKIGDIVTLWGDGLSIETIAACVNTIPNELLCHLTGRVQYCYS